MATKPTYEQLEKALRDACDAFAKQGNVALGVAMYRANELLSDIDLQSKPEPTPHGLIAK